MDKCDGFDKSTHTHTHARVRACMCAHTHTTTTQYICQLTLTFHILGLLQCCYPPITHHHCVENYTKWQANPMKSWSTEKFRFIANCIHANPDRMSQIENDSNNTVAYL